MTKIVKWKKTLSTTEPFNNIGLVKVRQDNTSETWQIRVTENNRPYDFSSRNIKEVYFNTKFSRDRVVEQRGEIIDAKKGIIQYTMNNHDMQQANPLQAAYFEFRTEDGSYVDSTQTFFYHIIPSKYQTCTDGSSYIIRLEELFKLYQDFYNQQKQDAIDYQKDQKDLWEKFVESNREILESIDPGGKILIELIDGRYSKMLDKHFSSLQSRGDYFDDQLGLLSVSDNIGKYEINPDNLVKLGEKLTDSQIMQRAIDFCEQYNRDYSIRLGRFYEITETLRVSMNRPFLFIRGAGGGLINKQDDFMFSGREDKWSGGLYFKNVKFKEGTSEHALIEGGSKGKIIQVITDGCSFHKTPTFIKSEEFLQTVRILNTDIINITDYFIDARNVYDVKFDNFLHEASTGGLLRLTETSTSNYAAMSLAIENGVIEGISKQPAISTTHLIRANFNNLYFEGNEFLDMDLSNGTKPHVGLSINNCFFGDNVNPDKKAGVKLGDMYTEVLSYDLSSNTSTNTPIFDFSKTNRNVNVDVSNCMVLDGKSIYAEQTDKMTSLNKKLRIKKLAEKTGMNFRINLDEYFAFFVENEIYVSAVWTRKGSPLYKNKFVGHLVFKTGMKDGKTMIKVEFRPTMSYTNTNFNDDSTVQLEPVWQSTLNEYLPVTSTFQKVTDSILLKNISGTQEVLDKCNYFVVSDILGI
ncbi:BppU family phage baseplate upper protein [Vagococcus sp. JNUCC 83]